MKIVHFFFRIVYDFDARLNFYEIGIFWWILLRTKYSEKVLRIHVRVAKVILAGFFVKCYTYKVI